MIKAANATVFFFMFHSECISTKVSIPFKMEKNIYGIIITTSEIFH